MKIKYLDQALMEMDNSQKEIIRQAIETDQVDRVFKRDEYKDKIDEMVMETKSYIITFDQTK